MSWNECDSHAYRDCEVRAGMASRVTSVTFASDSNHGSWDAPEATLTCKSEGPEPERRTLPYATVGRGERGLPCCLHTVS